MTTPGPDRRLYDVGLQPERTALAWRRTGLALTVAGFAALRALPEAFGPWALVPATLGLLASLTVVVLAHRRYRVTHETLTRGDTGGDDARRATLPSGLLPVLVATLVTCGGLAALALVVAAPP
jgi:putative membrane protein